LSFYTKAIAEIKYYAINGHVYSYYKNHLSSATETNKNANISKLNYTVCF